MLLFADSGSTKTDWLISDRSGKEIFRTQSIGLNPLFVSEEQVVDSCKKTLPKLIKPIDIQHVFMYSAGCGNEKSRLWLKQIVEDYFPIAIVHINTDILGAARSIYQNRRGIAAILGTGSNVCVYNGKDIYRKVHSLGFILGDEGSGSFLGKELLKRYYNSKFKFGLQNIIKEDLSVNYNDVIENLYNKPYPGRFLASFTPFIFENRNHPDVEDILKYSFKEFFENYIKLIPERYDLPIGFCGSVAFYFQDIIERIAVENDCKIQGFIKEPLDGIVKFHLNNSEFIDEL
jgi:glucosamine kinase